MSEERQKYMRVPTNPKNVFNDLYNVGLFGGTVTGLIGGYFLGGKILPFMKRIFSASLTGETKLVLVINTSLGMSKGKIASQCTHGSIQAYRKMLKPLNKHKNGHGLMKAWEMCGQPTVALRAQDGRVMLALEKEAKSHDINVCKVFDAGRTEVAAGSLTVMAVGPAPVLLLDKVTGNLKLL